MATPQSKTFTWGSYAYKSESNAYVLELTLTENSTNQANNTSNVSYSLVLKSGSNNRFDGQIDSVIKLNGVQVASGSKQITAAYNSSWILLTGNANVTHGTDGSLNMPIAVSINTYNSYAPPDKTLSWNWALTTIPRASSITAAGNVILGQPCSVRWTPNSAAFRYKLKFSIGGWSHTTGAIHPNKVSNHTYTEYTLPMDVARQITGDDHGTMTVVLTTYSDSSCSNAIGTDSEVFTVTVPENDDTRPTVEMALAAVDDFNGLYLQGRTKLQGTLKASGQYGADIKSLTMKVDGKTYTDPWLSNALNTPGAVLVVATAVDSRGFTGTAELTVQVLPYFKPRLTATAYRCLADGTPADNGEFLKIKASAQYAPVEGSFSFIAYRYKSEGGEYTALKTLVSGKTDSLAVDTDALLEGQLLKENAYLVQILAIDSVGEEPGATPTTVPIPSERIYKHKRAGGKGLGLGGYCEGDDLLDVHWGIRARKGLKLGDTPILEMVYPVGSIYISVAETDPGALFGGTWERLQDRFLLGAGGSYAAGTTGGEKEHLLTVSELPSHSHEERSLVTGYDGWAQKTIGQYTTHVPHDSGAYTGTEQTVHAAWVSANADTAAAGGGKAHNNMPPYLAVYMWKRTK